MQFLLDKGNTIISNNIFLCEIVSKKWLRQTYGQTDTEVGGGGCPFRIADLITE